FFSGSSEILELVAKKATTVFFNSESSRSNAEVLAPSLCERTRIFGPGSDTVAQRLSHDRLVSSPVLVQAVSSLTDKVNETLRALGEEYREMPKPPVTHVVWTRQEELRIREVAFGDVRFLPGVEFTTQVSPISHEHQRVSLFDDTADPHSKAWRLQEIIDANALPLTLSGIE